MGVKVSVLGDSISTYENYSNNVIDRNDPAIYYPVNEPTVNSVTKTWWWDAILQMGGQIVSNDSIAGSCVVNYSSLMGHASGRFCMNNQARINDLGDSNVTSSNHPDVIMFFGGTNDICQSGVFKNEDFINSYSNAVRMMYERYSNSIAVLCITPYSNSYLTTNAESGNDVRFGQVCAGIALVVNHYKAEGRRCKLVSLQDINLVEGIDANVGHPTASGMHTIADRVAYVYKNS